MKSTGIVRKVDELGRIVLPIELRRTLDIAEKDAIEIYEGAARRQIRSMQKIPLPDRRRDFCRKSKSTGVCRIETSCGPLLY